MFYFLLFATILAPAFSLSWKTCLEQDASPAIEVKKFTVSPDRLTFPGKLFLSAKASLNRSLSDVDVQVKISRKVFGFDVPIPCYRRQGSCRYNDVCDKLLRLPSSKSPADQVHRQILQHVKLSNGQKFQADLSCPFQAGWIEVDGMPVELPEMPSGMISSVVSGKYNLMIKIFESKQPVFCIQVSDLHIVRQTKSDGTGSLPWWKKARNFGGMIGQKAKEGAGSMANWFSGKK